ncbi:hypothetical protein, partial [Paenibacillus forsythiae]
ATTPIFAVGLCISLIGVALSAVLRKLERDLFFWKPLESAWSAAPAPRTPRSRLNRIFAVTVLSAMLLLLVAGGASTSRLSKTNGSFSGEGDVPPPTSGDGHSGHMSHEHSLPAAGHSGHSGHTAPSDSPVQSGHP